jgi:hypothetical protein
VLKAEFRAPSEITRSVYRPVVRRERPVRIHLRRALEGLCAVPAVARILPELSTAEIDRRTAGSNRDL